MQGKYSQSFLTNWEFRGEFSVSGLGGTRVILGVSAQAAFAELSYFLKDFLREKNSSLFRVSYEKLLFMSTGSMESLY